MWASCASGLKALEHDIIDMLLLLRAPEAEGTAAPEGGTEAPAEEGGTHAPAAEGTEAPAEEGGTEAPAEAEVHAKVEWENIHIYVYTYATMYIYISILFVSLFFVSCMIDARGQQQVFDQPLCFMLF